MAAPAKIVLVTGANAGIGYALCKQLAVEHGCYVFMGARNVERGNNAIKALVDEAPEVSDKVKLVHIDTTNTESIQAAVKDLAAKLDGKKLYGLVNNAGVGIAHNVSNESIINTNLYGVKSVTEAFLPLIDEAEGRIVNLGSGGGPSYVSKLKDKATQDFLSSKMLDWAELEDYLKKKSNYLKIDGHTCYGLSKALLHKYTEIAAKAHPNLKINAVSPGFIQTAMTKGYGASLPPEKGTVSILHCLFKELKGNGWYYGSDAKRSPLHFMRNPGEPEFEGY
uniref:Protochlorophyllide reductase n=1 Tax=Pyramimonas obovata TaxID=1411642 RepID=A0A7S0MTZ0_9CHLO|mmetsp:Transcript_1338/g.2681  ORF Transcript_1338/g.2681 Transcript_1338/m.2681 type:complete len:280 (+) Transcript_1338:41-880(+)